MQASLYVIFFIILYCFATSSKGSLSRFMTTSEYMFRKRRYVSYANRSLPVVSIMPW